MFAYLNDGVIGASGANQIRLSDWKLGDMAAINNTQFLVLEAALRGTTDRKKVYMIDISGATPVTSGLYNGSTLEGLVDAAGLAANGITPVSKTMFLDLLANGWPAVLDKAEGLAIINDSTIAICNDNDYGQSSPTANGVATATTNKGHLFTYRLSGANKISSFQAVETTLSQGITGQSTTQSPYLQPTKPGANFTSILSAGDVVGGYKMCGTPDGLGAFDNGNGTFTLLMNHEFGNTAGVARAHGAQGAFVSKWVINKNNLSVVSGADLIQRVYLWNPGTSNYTLYSSANPSTLVAFNRFCSADLPAVSAFYNSATGKGTQERIFMNGEEAGNEGRALGHIVTGAAAGTTYELPWLGKFSWENSVANPYASDKTVVAGMDDATPGQVYMYIGTKTTTGTDIDKAGLNGGKLFGVKVVGLLTETNATNLAIGTHFSLADLGQVQNKTGATLQTESNNLGITSFLRPEDGAWDPSNPRDFYFATTNGFGSPSRLWRLRFDDVANPEAGGTIEAVLNGTEGQQMLDNITIDKFGHIILVEDVGNNAHNGKVWQYNIATDEFFQVGQHDPTRFITGGANFLTTDEESSGPIDVQEILGPGWFLQDDQAHYGISGEVVEGGQLLAFYNPNSYTCDILDSRLYVNKSNSNPGNGSSWSCAINELSDAVQMANNDPAIKSIWVAGGTYKPTNGTNRYASLAITRGDLQIIGGFTGNESLATDANPVANPTVISGDIATIGDQSDNSYRLIDIHSLGAYANGLTVDGFTLEQANGNVGGADFGGGLAAYYNSAATMVKFKHTIFRNNSAGYAGGAAYLDNANVTFDSCSFIANTSPAGGAIFGFTASPIFNACVFATNNAGNGNGGAYYGNVGNITFNKTAFNGNQAQYGAAVFQNSADASYINSVVSNNAAAVEGGGIYQHNNSQSTLLNTTIFKNSAGGNGGGLVLGYNNCGTTTQNSIFYKNTSRGDDNVANADVYNFSGTTNVFAYNMLQSNTAVPADNGSTIINNNRGSNPAFINESSVLGMDGKWFTSDDGLQLQAQSPAANTGNNAPVNTAGVTTDISNATRIVCVTVDKGAYENQAACASVADGDPAFAGISFTKGFTNAGTGVVMNPFSNELQIRYLSSEKAAITVTAATGKIVHQANAANGVTSINSASWSSGLYNVVIVTAAGKKINFKTIKL